MLLDSENLFHLVQFLIALDVFNAHDFAKKNKGKPLITKLDKTLIVILPPLTFSTLEEALSIASPVLHC